MPRLLSLLLVPLLLLGTVPLWTETNPTPPSADFSSIAEKDPVAISLISEYPAIQAGQPFWVAVRFDIDDQWHAYWKNPGDAGMAPIVNWELPKGFQVTQTLWPTPESFALASSRGFGYNKELVLLVEITPPTQLTTTNVDLKGSVRWVVCSDLTCLPGDTPIALNLSVSDHPQSGGNPLFNQVRAQVPQKHELVSAQRNQDTIELAFTDPSPNKRPIRHAEFFPETKKSVHYTSETPQPHSSIDNAYVLSIKEINANSSIKGLLVLHTDQGKESYEIDLPVEKNSSLISMSDRRLPSTERQISADSSFDFQGGFFLALGFAFLGGLILNLMPCVLPVISFKVLSFVKLAGQSRKLIFQHGLAFSLGVLISFWVLAALLLILQAYGRSVGWGFQLQEPIFVSILAALLFLFGLSLFGLFEIGTSMIAAASQAQERSKFKNALIGSFFSGVLATAVATPCTGPFLGSAVGFAVTLPAAQAMLIFTSLGLGMSAPYLALAAFPALLKFMPKPGNWMITFKEIMGFFMIATVLWLVWVFGAQTNSFAVTLLLGSFFFLSVAAWIYGKWGTPIQKALTRRFATVTALVLFCVGAYTTVLASSSWAEAMGGGSSHVTSNEIADVWEEFSPERLAELRERGTPVFIDFTAKWCLICQANHLTLSTSDVAKKFEEKGVIRMKADWTKRDEVIAGELRKFGRNSVPLYVLYGKDQSETPEILPQVLTPEGIIASIEKL